MYGKPIAISHVVKGVDEERWSFKYDTVYRAEEVE
jgi:hypothetical protein